MKRFAVSLVLHSRVPAFFFHKIASQCWMVLFIIMIVADGANASRLSIFIEYGVFDKMLRSQERL